MPDYPVCLNCGKPMIELKCKARCQHCGYFEDCSDLLTRHEIRGGRPAAPSSADPKNTA